jgi:uncharacterized RDD family membrane protein YckC
VATAVVTEHRVPYAGIATRGVALAIDAGIVQGGLVVFAALVSLVGQLVGGLHLGPVGQVLAAAGWAIVTVGYFVAFWSIDGQTPGMRAMHLRVTTADGGAPGALRSLTRAVVLALCIIPVFLGLLPVLFDDRRRGVHDMVARTVVLYDPRQP